MKLTAVCLAALALAAASAAAGSTRVARITIRHQAQGCHAWSVDGGPYRARLAITLPSGGTIDFMNDDVMPHRLVQLAGPRLTMPPQMIRSTFKHPGGGNVSLRFGTPGTYRFRTVDDDDSGAAAFATDGPENLLRLTVVVR
jgi:hypothetical protein